MQIISAASAFPKHYYPQAVLLQALQTYWGAELEKPELLHRLHRNTGVDGRHLALPLQAYPKLSRWGEVNDLWIQVALDLGKQSICRALADAGLSARDLGAFFFTSVTGIASPSIDALLINRIGMSPNIRRLPMFGLGCVAGCIVVSLFYSASNLAEFQAIQMWRIEWLLAATASFVAGILLKKPDQD